MMRSIIKKIEVSAALIKYIYNILLLLYSMRSIKLLFCLLLIVHAAFGTDYELAKKLAGLNASQRVILYQYGTLISFATPAQADSFWQAHPVPGISITEAKELANELLVNSALVYEVKKPSRLQTLRGIFTATRLLLGLAGLLCAYALVHLLGSYWSALMKLLIRYFAPLFRILFSPILLTIELLVLGAVAVYFGPKINEVFIRTLVIHLGLFAIWGQLIAISTKKYFVKDYMDAVFDSFDGTNPLKHSFFHVFVPSFVVTALYVWVIAVCGDRWYPYEVIVPAMIAVYSFPLVRMMQKPLSRLIFPFPNTTTSEDLQIAACIAVSVFVWIALLYLPVTFLPALTILSGYLSLIMMSIGFFRTYRGGRKNYIYVQIISFLFLVAVVFAGTQRQLTQLTWTGLGGIFMYVMIKYWEWPTHLGWSWRNRKAWGLLGMALIIWCIATLIRMLPEWFVHIF
jgi:hypothetical protein